MKTNYIQLKTELVLVLLLVTFVVNPGPLGTLCQPWTSMYLLNTKDLKVPFG